MKVTVKEARIFKCQEVQSLISNNMFEHFATVTAWSGCPAAADKMWAMVDNMSNRFAYNDASIGGVRPVIVI